MHKFIIIDTQHSEFFTRLSTGLVLTIKDIRYAERFNTLEDAYYFVRQEITSENVLILQEIDIPL